MLLAGCENLTEIIITSPINAIEKHTFDGCSSLKQILIPSSVTSIGKYAFNECISLKQIAIPSSVTSIGNNTFYHCSSVTNVFIDPSSTITSIQNSTFELCTSLIEISIPQSVTSINQFAFKSYKELNEIIINCHIEKIESNAFDDCPSLQIIPKSKFNQLKEFQNHFLYPININIIVIGSCGVGKTCIVNRYVDDEFQENTHRTLCFNLRTKHINICGNNINLQIWDTSSSECYYSVIRQYCGGETCVIIVTDFEGSHDSLQYLVEMQNDIGPIPAVILRNKCDLTEPNIKLVRELENFQRKYNLQYFDVSAKNNVNIDKAFQYVANEAFHHIRYH